MKLKKNDEVQVMSGKDSGKRAKIEEVLVKKEMVLVGGINQYKRHVKGRTQGQKSEIKTITKPMPASVVMFVCPKCHKAVRLGYNTKNNKKIRICKKCKQEV